MTRILPMATTIDAGTQPGARFVVNLRGLLLLTLR